MHVIVIEARGYERTVEVDDLGFRPDVLLHAGIGADVDKTPVQYRYCRGARILVIDGPQLAVPGHEVRILCPCSRYRSA